jgi:hypothetical protein
LATPATTSTPLATSAAASAAGVGIRKSYRRPASMRRTPPAWIGAALRAQKIVASRSSHGYGSPRESPGGRVAGRLEGSVLRTFKRPSRPRRFSALVLSVALLGGVAASCSPPSSGGSGPSATEQFCDFWDKVEEAPPTAEEAVLVKDKVVALADDTAVTGSDCTDSAAKVELDGAVLAEGKEVPAEQGTTSTEKIAAVTGDEISAGEPVLENLTVKALSVEIGLQGIKLRGNVSVRLSGVTSTIGFVGTLSNLDNWSISLSSAGLTIPGVTVSPVVFNGTLKVTNGAPSLTMTANASKVKVGDITVEPAALTLSASPATGVSAKVQGTLKVGPSTATGVVDVAFDKAGALVSAKADIVAHLVGAMAGNKKIDLTGSVKLEGNATETAVSFNGHGILGDMQVNDANGALTLATNKATFVGVLDIQQGLNSLRFNGSIVWDGITAYSPFLQLQGNGEFSGTMNDGKTVTASGELSTEVIGGQSRTVVTGNFQVGTLKAVGSAIVETNGSSTILTVDADLVDAGFNAQLTGVVIITDGLTETLELDAVVDGVVSLGDATLSGANLHLSSTYGSPLDLDFSGGLQVGSSANLTGSVKATIGPNGQLLSLGGSMTGSLLLDSWGVANFSGTVVASPEQVTLSGAGRITVINFPLGIDFKGSFTSSLTSPAWSLNGSGAFRIASIQVASARLSLSLAEGMKATRVGFYFSIIGIPTYFEGDFYMKPAGGCDKVVITGGSVILKLLLKGPLSGAVGCPVF